MPAPQPRTDALARARRAASRRRKGKLAAVRRLCRKLTVEAPGKIGWFNRLVLAAILATALGLGLETSEFGQGHAAAIYTVYTIALLVFVLEAAVRLTAVFPRFGRYFGDGWNLFDFIILVLALIPDEGPFALLARLARLLRVVRLFSVVPQLRLIVSTLIRSMPGLGHVVVLLLIIYYVYAVAGVHLFREHDPVHWGTLGTAFLTLFRVMTFEDWTDVMYVAMAFHPLSWMYFVSFVLLAAIVMTNLVIAVVINNLQGAQVEVDISLQGSEDTLRALRQEAERARDALERVERHIADLKK